VDNIELRDFFAAHAMSGLTAKQGGFDFVQFHDDPWRVAAWAYDIADQMLKVRQDPNFRCTEKPFITKNELLKIPNVGAKTADSLIEAFPELFERKKVKKESQNALRK